MLSLLKRLRRIFQKSRKRPARSLYHEIDVDNSANKTVSRPDDRQPLVCDPTGAPIKLLGLLDSGRLGRVIVGERYRRTFAIKTYDITRSSGRKRSNREQRLLREFTQKHKHPFIIPLQLSFVYAGHIFLFMDWCPTTLAGRLTSGQIFAEEVVLYAAQLLSAVEHLHSLGIIHRDIKPLNILINECGDIQLADFGFSHRFDLRKQRESHKITKKALRETGTDDYMAPEANEESCAPLSYPSDIYSYGRVFMKLCMATISPDLKSLRLLAKTPILPSAERDLCGAATRHRCDMRPTARELMEFEYFDDIDWTQLVKKPYTNPHKPQFPKIEELQPLDVEFCRRLEPSETNGICNYVSGLFRDKLVFVSPQIYEDDYAHFTSVNPFSSHQRLETKAMI